MNTYLLARFRACQWRHGVLTGRWTEVEIERINRRVAELADRLRDVPTSDRGALTNMRGNGWERIVRTRRGNFQPLEPQDVVISEQAAEVSR